jgi:energy-coupling factor transporter ATP-binding protein EcfA2
MEQEGKNINYRQVDSLETEVKKFADELPYWSKFLAEKILSGKTISDNDIDISYFYLLEHLKLKEETVKPEITIKYNTANNGNYKPDLLLMRIENVEGVNALVENQIIEFSPNLTIIYGANGSGKSGYVRLLKKVFYAKAQEEILPNVHIDSGHKNVNAKFTFKSNNTEIPLTYEKRENNEFQQFAVFDGKGLLKQLSEKNEFEFRPAGLSFFADYTNAVNRVEQKLNTEIQTKQSGNTASDLSDLFDGDSEIKTIVQNLKAETKIDDLKKYTPFYDEDKTQKEAIQKQYDELLLASKGKEKEIKNLETVKSLLAQNKQAIEKLNQCFTTDVITKIKTAITDCVTKEATAKAEGIENFKTDKIEGVGTSEWKNFIIAADAFAKTQNKENAIYPKNGDNCLLCQQPLSYEAQKLISNYWTFIKSIAEQNAKQAQEKLEKAKQNYEGLNFDLFPQDNTLTDWLTEKYPNELETLKQKLTEQKTLAQNIVSDIQSKTVNERMEINVSVEQHTTIDTAIEILIKNLKEDEISKELDKLLTSKTLLEHKEKFNMHFSKFEAFVNNQVWIKNANKADYAKRKITETEKALSNKYFNQKYIDTFNEECQKLNGNFGIDINHTGLAGKSFRQLKLKGKNPNAVLSEGEQKVIAIADFLAEMQLSEINRGLFFDDPVNSLDEKRKDTIAKRLVELSDIKQSIVFTHDLVFVYALISHCSECNRDHICHWIENRDSVPGYVWLNNSPSYEKEYRNANPVKKHYDEAKKTDCPPAQREYLIKAGFTALRTCYEVLVINDLFCNVVQRFNERVSVDSLSSVCFDSAIINELQDSFGQCCRYMEGHSHSDKFAYQKPELNNLNEEIQRYDVIKKKIKDAKKK